MMNDLKAEIIAIGTELLLGQIANTNAQWIAEQFALLGINTYYHTVVGDNEERVKDTFLKAKERSNLMIVTGGLGPTEDDLTREAFQHLTEDTLIEHKPSVIKMNEYFNKQNQTITPNNYRQTRVFQQAIVIENKYGMAPGMIIEDDGRIWVFLPGVPREMKQMMKDTVFPYLLEKFHQKTMIQSLILRFIGIGEANLEYTLKDLIQNQENPTIALLARPEGLIIRLTVKETSKERANEKLHSLKDEIQKRVGKHLYGINEDTIEHVLIQTLIERKEKISVAESLTGGKFLDKLISVEGASKVCPGGIVAYNRNIKEKFLNIPKDLLDQHGVVSEVCALQMAQGIAKKMNTDYGISFTGVAGPDKLEGHPVGTVFIGLYDAKADQFVQHFVLTGDRTTIRNRAISKGFEMLYMHLKSKNS